MYRLVNEEYAILPEGHRKLYLHYLSLIDLRKWIEYYQNEAEDFLRVLKIPTFKIFFEDLISTPDLSVKKIRKFLSIDSDIELAVENIKGELK
jgi:hypothetical protein